MVDTVFAATIEVKIAKCKVAGTTARQEEFYIRHGFGIDNLWTLYDVAKAHGIIKGGNWVTWIRPNGEEFRKNGFQQFYNALVADPALQAEFESVVLPMLSTVPDKNVDDEAPEESIESLLAGALGGEDEDEE